MSVTGTQTRDDGLRMAEWHSHYDSGRHSLLITGYFVSERETRRHNFKVVQRYNIYDRRSNTLGEIPEIPQILSDKMLQAFSNSLTIQMMKIR